MQVLTYQSRTYFKSGIEANVLGLQNCTEYTRFYGVGFWSPYYILDILFHLEVTEYLTIYT